MADNRNETPMVGKLAPYMRESYPMSRGARTLRAVLVEDDPLARKYLREVFYELSTQIDVRECDTLENAFKYLERGNVDVVLLDLNLPDSQGKETFELLHTRFPHVPIVIATGDDRLEFAYALIAEGAADYVLKSEKPISIFRRVLMAVERWRHTVPAKQATATDYHRLEAAGAGMTAARKSGHPAAMKAATEERDGAMLDVSKRMLSEILTSQVNQKQMLGLLDDIKVKVELHDRILVRGDTDRPPLRHEVRELSKATDTLRKSVDELEDQVEDHERDSIVMEKTLETEKKVAEVKANYSTERWTLAQKVVAGVVSVIITIVSGYFAVRQTKQLIRDATPAAVGSAR